MVMELEVEAKGEQTLVQERGVEAKGQELKELEPLILEPEITHEPTSVLIKDYIAFRIRFRDPSLKFSRIYTINTITNLHRKRNQRRKWKWS